MQSVQCFGLGLAEFKLMIRTLSENHNLASSDVFTHCQVKETLYMRGKREPKTVELFL